MKDENNITYRHRMPAQLRFSDVDTFGHVNNSVYFSLFDMGKTQYFIDVVGEHVFDDISIVVAHITADFLAPVFYPDEIAIETAVTRLGTKSFTLVQRALNVRTNEVKCECQTVMVAFDSKSQQSVPMPEIFKQKIRDYEPSPLS